MVLAVFMLGLILGSFLNVVIHRMKKGQSLAFPASHCPVCKGIIKFYDNIPLLSYALLRGKCRNCGQRISIRYPLVELLTGLSLALLYIRFGYSSDLAVFGVLVLFLIPISFIDWDRGLIRNKLFLLVFRIENWKELILGCLGGGLLVWLIAVLGKIVFKKESLGMGDVKLIGLIGIYVGFPEVYFCFFFGALSAAVYILTGFIFKKISMGSTIPFGPFIAIGTLGHLLAGQTIINWYLGLFY